MKSITDIGELAGKTVLVRVDYNVPLVGNRITDARRIESSYKTIDFLLRKKARVVLIAHLGKETDSLAPIATFLNKKKKTYFIVDDVISGAALQKIKDLPEGSLILLENIRFYKDEEKNTVPFAKALAKLGDLYVNDAFSVSHRNHASVVGIPKYLPSFAGFQLEKEIAELSLVLENPKSPFLFILGGAKFSTKIPLLKRFTALANEIVIAGAILNSFYKASGFEVGKSVVDSGYDTEIKRLMSAHNLLLPIDVLVERAGKTVSALPYEIQKGDIIVDIGPQSVSLIAEKISKAKLVVWNGPTGWYEKGYTKMTTELAKVIVKSKAKAIIGGGDTGAVIEKIAQGKKNIFVSTGGGATLDFLANSRLPGIDALH